MTINLVPLFQRLLSQDITDNHWPTIRLTMPQCDGCEHYDYDPDTGPQCYADHWRDCPGAVRAIAEMCMGEE